MKKNLGQIIGKRDCTEGTIYYTEICDYVVYEAKEMKKNSGVYEEERKIVVEGLLRGLKKEINFIPEDEKGFVIGIFDNEKEAFKGITDFEKSQWGKEGIK